MSMTDVLRTLDCWLWRIDPSTERVVTVGGSSLFGATPATWRSLLRLCASDDRRAVFEAMRLVRASEEDGTLRVEDVVMAGAAGHRHHVDLLLARQRDTSGLQTWMGSVSRRWPSARRAAPEPEPVAASVAGELDAAGMGWWSLENLEEGLSLSRTAARLMGFGDSACSVPLGAWLAHAPPQDYPRLMKYIERILGGEIDRFEMDLRGADPARPQHALRITALRARTPGNELVGVIEAVYAPAPARQAPAAGPAPANAGATVSSDTGLDRDSLVREIHHRIKNHLQGMTGLIERYRNDYPGLGEALDAIGGQLHSIGTVYGLLARSGRSDLALDEIAQAVTDGLGGIATNGVQTRFPEDMGRWRIAEQHCVAIALVVNELLMNAIKHGGSQPGMPPVSVDCTLLPQGCMLCIRNEGTLPPGFDFDSGKGARTGLQLVRTMLPGRGAKLSVRTIESAVEVSLLLEPPVLSQAPYPAGALSHA